MAGARGPAGTSGGRAFRLGDWKVVPDTCRLSRADTEVRIEPKSMAVLAYLASRAGDVVTRQALEESVWSGTVVGYKAVTNAIIKLRKALQDDARKPRYIETISKHGYRLIADVEVLPARAGADQRPARSPVAILYAAFDEHESPERSLQDRLLFVVTSHHGCLVERAHGVLVGEFDSPPEAVSAALAMQKAVRATDRGERGGRLRIGLHAGDHVRSREATQIAARLQALIEPGRVCVSQAVCARLGGGFPCDFIGEYLSPDGTTATRAYCVHEPVVGQEPVTGAAMPSRPAFAKPSISIKPFVAIGPDAAQTHFADAFTSGIVVALTRIPGLVIVDDESPHMEVSKGLTAKGISRRFGVRFVLKGTLEKHADRIRLSAELLETATGQYRWAESFDRQLTDSRDYFGLQDEIVGEIVTALDVKLLGGEAVRFVRRALDNTQALERYYEGEELLWRATTRLELREAERLFDEVARLEPASPVGHAAGALANWVEAQSALSDTPERSVRRAEERARRAIELDDVTGYAHMVLAHIHLGRHEFDEAMVEATHAVSDRPSCPTAYSIKASVLTYLGHACEAVEFASYALRLTPAHHPMYPAVLASAYYGCDRYEEALSAAADAVNLAATDVAPHLVAAASSAALGRHDWARASAAEVLRVRPEFRLSEYARSQPFKDRGTLDRLVARLRAAGLPL